MKRKSILALALVAMLGTSILLTGCGNSTNDSNTQNNSNTATDSTKTTDNGNNATTKLDESADNAKDAVKEGADAVKNGVEGVGDAIKYTAVDVKDDFVKAGHDIKDSLDTKKDYFIGTETDYLAGNDLVRVYEFDNSADLDAAIATISSDGLSINNEAVYTTKPYYYRKGDTLVVYEGNDEAYLNEFNTLYGTTIMP